MIAKVARQYDAEGRVLALCRRAGEGGCDDEARGAAVPFGRASTAAAAYSTFRYSAEGLLVASVTPGDLHTELSYDSRGRLAARSQREGLAGNLRQRTFTRTLEGDVAAIATLGLAERERFEYDGLRRLVQRDDVRGYTWHYAYTDRGLPDWITTRKFDVHGRRIESNVNGIVTRELLNDAGQTIEATVTYGPQTISVTRFEHDLQDNVLVTTDSEGNLAVVTNEPQLDRSTAANVRIDEAGEALTTTRIVQKLGRTLDTTVAGHQGERVPSSVTLDALDRPIESTNPEGYTTTTAYDLLGRPVSVETWLPGAAEPDELTTHEHAWGVGQSLAGSTVITADPAGDLTTRTYNAFGEMTSRDAAGIGPFDHHYDNAGRRFQTDLPDGGVLNIDYDKAIDPVAVDWTPPQADRVRLIDRTFDGLGRLAEATYHNVLLASLSYPDTSVTRAFSYDRLGRVRAESVQFGGGAPRTVTSDWALVPGGERARWQRSVTYPTGTTWARTHDEIGRLVQMGRAPDAVIDLRWWGELQTGRTQIVRAAGQTLEESSTYDGLGRRLSWAYEYDDLWQSQTLFRQQVVRDVMGRARAAEWTFGHELLDPDQPHLRPWRGFEYDERGRFVGMWRHPDGGDAIDGLALVPHAITNRDVISAAAELGPGSSEHSYEREAVVGGLTSIVDEADGSTLWSTPMVRGAGHQLQQVEVDGVVYTLAHDDMGRVTQMEPGWRFEYDPLDRLVAVRDDAGALLEAYAYDALGQLVAVYDRAGDVTRFVHDGPQMVVAEDDAAVPVARWEAAWGAGIDQLVEWRDLTLGAGENHIPLTDFRRSIVAAWRSSTGTLDTLAQYDPHGRVRELDSEENERCNEVGHPIPGEICPHPNRLPFGFVSAWRSAVTGLVYMRNRWYHPRLAQFLSHDPLGPHDSPNLYAYTPFDPINGWDPWGMESKGTAENTICDGDLCATGAPGDPSTWVFTRTCTGSCDDEGDDPSTEAGWTGTKEPEQWALAEPPVGRDGRYLSDQPGETPVDKAKAMGREKVANIKRDAAELGDKVAKDAAESMAWNTFPAVLPWLVKLRRVSKGVLGRLTSIGSGRWRSSGGLIYGQGSRHGNRVKHVLEHIAADVSKARHSVFVGGRKNVLGLVDDAWLARGKGVVQGNGNTLYSVPMGRQIGTAGETTINIVIKKGTSSEVITAFPTF